MADQWRILVVVDEEDLNWGIVNTLRKDGYVVQGVMNGADAIGILWSEECDVVISDLKTPGADSFELLQWLRTYRPNTRLIMVSAPGSSGARTQALESGAASYLEKPVDLHLLKEELRRLLQQTGFSASLDSFDLLDVIQIITMSRKSIALLINTGLEERGVLRFQGGELIWAEYGMLRGEEAFFALAAHKNGMAIHQPWNEQITPNVTQPLSRLIFQALQYRTKYAARQQMSGEYEVIARTPITQTEEDDSPFQVLEGPQGQSSGSSKQAEQGTGGDGQKEWWQQTGNVTRVNNESGGTRARTGDTPRVPAGDAHSLSNSTNIVPSTVRKTPASQRTDLPSWLTDQPTSPRIPEVRPSSLSNSAQVPATPVFKPSPAEWQPPRSRAKTSGLLPEKQPSGPQRSISADRAAHHTSSPEWQPPENPNPPRIPSGSLQSLASAGKTGSAPSGRQDSGSMVTEDLAGSPRTGKRNYPALVSALQTLGYSITGFIAAAVVSLNGQPIAQVAVDDLDISRICAQFSSIMRGVLQSLDEGAWGEFEDAVITSADRHIFLRIVGSNRDAFQVLITSRESDLKDSLELISNVDAAISGAV